MNVIANQSLFDIAVQQNGGVLTVIDWGVKNNLSPTAVLIPGTELVNAVSIYTDIERAAYFKNRQQAIATLFIPDAAEAPSYLDYLFPQTFPLL